jgi:alcohol dehydrogenase (cytochrome c)
VSAALLALLLAQQPVTLERLRAGNGADWLTYSGNYQAHRHCPLGELDTGNVARLVPLWVYQSHESGKLETTPLVADGIVYLTERSPIVTALDARTGRPLWSYRRPVPEVAGCCGPVNRGAALLGDTLFYGTIDAHLLALDARTGRVRWDVTMADYKVGHSVTMAPLVVKDLVIAGVSGGELGVRAFIDAYDVRTGARRWRFWTIPGPGQPGHETWKGDSWKTGGAPTWVTGAYDPTLDLVYWGTGNPGPDYNGDAREGDNLYSDSLVALDPATGKLRWHFQFTPHDLHDWDSSQVPMLIDANFGGRPRKLVAQVNRNAFYYLLDRATGEFLVGAPYTKQTWASGLDARGRPRVIPGTAPTDKGVEVFPGLGGGTNWFSPSYSPATGLIYAQVHDDYAQVYYKLDRPFRPGAHFEGGAARDVEGAEHHAVIRAIEATTGKVVWSFPLTAPPSGGVLSTAGGLVFSGNREGMFFALDARSGKVLWKFQTGGGINSAAISFAVEGKQRVAIAAGQAIFVFGLP